MDAVTSPGKVVVADPDQAIFSSIWMINRHSPWVNTGN